MIHAGQTGTPVKETEEIRRPTRTQPFIPTPPLTFPTPVEVPVVEPAKIPVTQPQRAA